MHKLTRLFISSKDCVHVAHFIIDLPGCRLIKPSRALTSIEVNGVRATLVEWLLPRGIYYLLTSSLSQGRGGALAVAFILHPAAGHGSAPGQHSGASEHPSEASLYKTIAESPRSGAISP